MTTSTMLHIRIDEKVKNDAQQAFQAMGISMSDAVRLFLTRVIAEQAIPFEVKVPNQTTQNAMQEVEQMIQDRKAHAHHTKPVSKEISAYDFLKQWQPLDEDFPEIEDLPLENREIF